LDSSVGKMYSAAFRSGNGLIHCCIPYHQSPITNL
jgi:hypothetical protein